MSKTRKKIFIDARISGNDGIGRYTREIIKTISSCQKYSISCLTRNKDFIQRSFKVYLDSSCHYDIKEIENLDESVAKDAPDIVHCFDYRVPFKKYNNRLIVTIHDIFRYINSSFCYTDENFYKKIGAERYKKCEMLISYYDKPSNCLKSINYNSLHHKYYCYLLAHALKLADIIIVPSNVVKQDILDNFIFQTNNIHVIYHGLDHLPYNKKIVVPKKDNFFYILVRIVHIKTVNF